MREIKSTASKICKPQSVIFYVSLIISLLSGISGYSQNWLTAGNSGTNASKFIGTTDNVSLRFRTNNAEAALFDSLQRFITHKDALLNGLTIGLGGGSVAGNVAIGSNVLVN